MSQDYSSSNPFRRKGASSASSSVPLEPCPVIDNLAYQQTEAASPQSIHLPKKAAKKVRVQSPPPPSPSRFDSPSTIVEDDDSTDRPPTPIPRDDDPFGSTISDTSEEEGANKLLQAPPNPFQKTLETMEPSKRDAAISRTNVTNTGRASLDVDAFKRLLLTGNAAPGVSIVPSASLSHPHHTLGDGGSSTDASSLSRHSIFEPVQEPHLDSPSTPHETSEPEDDGRGPDLPSSANGRKKPLPPSSRHGKLIKIELRDEPSTATAAAVTKPQSQARDSAHGQSFSSPSSAISSPTDLNKPLPPAPARASYDSDRESIFDREAVGKAPEPPSPPHSIRRKTPPAPPLTRRHSQRVADSRMARPDKERLSPSVEEETANQTPPTIQSTASIDPTTSETRPRSDSGRVPPPPPSRRPASIRGSMYQSSSASSSSLPVSSPTLLPARNSSSRDRPQSAVMDTSTNKRASMIPPPPPPPRLGDVSRRTSGEYSRRSGESVRKRSGESVRKRSGESVRKGSETNSIQEGRNEERPDILADLSKLQREIDALRAKGERSVT
jgi:hypothetical protein